MSTLPTSILVTWNEVPAIDQNGIITVYEVMYTPLTTFGGQISTNTTNVSGSELMVTLSYLQEYVNYSISVRAYTSAGQGPESTVIELTQEAGKLANELLLYLHLKIKGSYLSVLEFLNHNLLISTCTQYNPNSYH